MADKDIWAELRKPFPKESVGKLPKGGVQLDYVGHAAVTDRLNTVDPTWTWEPMATDEQGLPLLTPGEPQFGKATKGLWIRLTIAGVTRPGYGDGKNEKEAIGDALRNAAMRFGVALDLWSKDELESNVEHPENKNFKPTEAPAAEPYENVKPALTPVPSKEEYARLTEALKDIGITENSKKIDFIRTVLDKPMPQNTSEIEKVIAATKGE